MTNKETYALLCNKYPQINIFMQEWWLSAVCAGKDWDVLFSRDENGEICAALPYLHNTRLFMKFVLMPQQTQLGGIWLRDDIRNDMAKVTKACQDLSEQLKALKLAYYYQQYTLNNPAVDVMQSLGFKKKERVTYRINDLSSIDNIISRFSKNKKRQLQKALSLHVDMDMNEEDFYRFHTQCLLERGKRISYTREFFLVLFRKAKAHNQGQLIAIRNEKEELCAAAFVVWDKQQLYYLIPCYSEAHKDTGAGALLVLEAIKFAQKVTQTFDFEGSMIRGVANHYKQFGSVPTPYYSISKYYNYLFWPLVVGNSLRHH